MMPPRVEISALLTAVRFELREMSDGDGVYASVELEILADCEQEHSSAWTSTLATAAASSKMASV